MRIPLPVRIPSFRPGSRIFGGVLSYFGGFIDAYEAIEGLQDRCFTSGQLRFMCNCLGRVGGFGQFGGCSTGGGFAVLPLRLAPARKTDPWYVADRRSVAQARVFGKGFEHGTNAPEERAGRDFLFRHLFLDARVFSRGAPLVGPDCTLVQHLHTYSVPRRVRVG